MDTIKLKSEIIIVRKIKRKSSARMFKDLKVNDIIVFSVPIETAGRNRSTYATYITITNIRTCECTTSSFNQLPKILEAFELEVR